MLPLDTALSWWTMLRALGLLFLLVLGVVLGPWGLLLCACLCAGWLWMKPTPPPTAERRSCSHLPQPHGRQLLSAIPLLNAVYCANCDLITNSPHDDCSVCGSRSVMAVSRIWKLTPSHDAPLRTARYKVSFIADVRGIPANELNESTKLLNRLADLGGDLMAFHIQVEPVLSSLNAAADDTNIEVLRSLPPTTISEWRPRRRAS